MVFRVNILFIYNISVVKTKEKEKMAASTRIAEAIGARRAEEPFRQTVHSMNIKQARRRRRQLMRIITSEISECGIEIFNNGRDTLTDAQRSSIYVRIYPIQLASETGYTYTRT